MNILIVSSYLPFPLHDGGSVRLYNIIKELSKKNKITLVCEIRSHQGIEDIKEVKKYCEEVIVIPHRRPWSFENMVKAGFSLYPLLLVMHTFPEMKKKIVETLNKKSFDVIHVETFYVYQNLPKTYLPIVLVEHNIEYVVYRRYADTSRPIIRPFLYADIAKIRYWEEKIWKKTTRLCAVTDEERQKMPRSDVAVVPNGVDIRTYAFRKIKERKTKKILFIGSFKWIQNVHSTELIIKEIWPKIRQRMESSREKNGFDIKLWVVGKSIPESLKVLSDASIVFDENAPDETWKIYQQSDILLAPIKVGGGSSYKIIEAMASGVPVVTTKLAAGALKAKHGQHLLTGETPEELAEATVQLLQNTEEYEKIRKNARELVEENYSWESIVKKLEKVYEEATKG